MTPLAPVPGLDLDALREELRAVLARLDLIADAARRLANAPAPSPAPAVPDPIAGLPPLISVEQAATVLGLSRTVAYRLAAAGELPARRLGGRVYIITARLRAVLDTEGAAA